jgi:iron complex outermembrane receptor protein
LNDFYLRTNRINGFAEHVNLPDTAGAVLQFSKFNQVFSGISASLGFTYFLRDHINLKLNVARGYRAPSITELASNGLDPGAHIVYLGNRSFSPEFSIQEDIGISFDYANVSAGCSFFNNHIQNYIYLNLLVDANNKPILDAQSNKTYQYQQASAQLYGAEFNLSLHPKSLKGFRMDNSFALLYAFNRDEKFKDKQLQGEYLPLIPPMKLTSSITQKVNLKSKYLTGFTPKIEFDFNASQDRYLALNGTETNTPSYVLVHLGWSTDAIALSKTSLQIHFQINNLL